MICQNTCFSHPCDHHAEENFGNFPQRDCVVIFNFYDHNNPAPDNNHPADVCGRPWKCLP